MCKSKGGLTKHQRSEFAAELGECSSSSEDVIIVTKEKMASLIPDIGRYLVDEKLYKKEHSAEVFKLEPSDSFVSFINQLLLKYKRKKNQDKFLKEFYGNTNSNWKE